MAGFRASMNMPLALFRCDASPVIGAGHVMRCLALAEALGNTGWRICFAVGDETVSTVPALATSEFDVHVLSSAEHQPEMLGEKAGGHADLLIVDHYQYDASFERTCRTFARKILVLDDATGRDHDCDFLVDAAAPNSQAYKNHVPASARVLTGPDYALIRKSFVAHRAAALTRRDGRPVREILVSCGATDPANATVAVLEALDPFVDEIPVTVVLASRALHIDAVRKRLHGKARVLLDVEDMVGLMTNADLAVGAAGSSAYERAVLGLPSILVMVAKNQVGIARLMCDAGAAIDGGIIDTDLSPRLRELTESLLENGVARRGLAEASSTLVDGRGAARIALSLLDERPLKNGAHVRLRLASAKDEQWLLAIQQHSQTRRFFRYTATPTIDEHQKWMRQTISDPDRLLLAIEADHKPVGSIRLDRLPNENGSARHEVAIAIDPKLYGLGIGGAALRLVRTLVPGAVLDAEILPGNERSRALFENAGFVEVSENSFRSSPLQGEPRSRKGAR
jgi:UDP-2,4-diacetamido-2,4,6-trideoxy-beta-L-altropyranose hydrolase